MADFRMPELNTVALAGRLVRDASLAYTPSQMPVCECRIAVPKRTRDKDGNTRDVAKFFNIVFYGRHASYLHADLKKGVPVLVNGALDETSESGKPQVRVVAGSVQVLEWTGAMATHTASAGTQTQAPAQHAPAPQEDEYLF